MKKITHLILFSVGLVFLFNIGNISAQEKAAFKARFSEAVNGNVTMIANNVLSRHKSDSYNGGAGNHDFTNNVFVDIDTENTFNSSNATFINPEPSLACLGIKKAYLYWAAADMEETDASDEPNWNYNQVKIKLPGAASYQTITADEVIYRGRTEHFVNDPYVCFKDITNQVSSLNSAYGTYQVANVKAKKGGLTSHGGGNTGTSGGWQIVFIYESPVLPAKNISLFDGYGHMTKDLGQLTISFTGFTTLPGNQQVNADIVIGALEGDRDLSGDKLQIQKVNNTWENLSYSNSLNQVIRSADNFFNSKITKNGNNFTNRYPSSENTLGFDADVFPLSNPNNSVIGNNQQSAKIKLISNQETYGLFLIGLSVDVWKPDLAPLVLSSTPANGASVNVGSLVNMSFQIKNNGNDNVKDLVTTVDIPEEVDLIEPIIGLPSGVSYNYNSTTRKLTFTSLNGITDIADQAYTINYQVKIKEQCYFLETKCSEEFQLQMLATYKGIKNTNTQTTKSSSTTINCGIGDEKPVTIKINRPAEANWVTVVNSLDRKISCDNVGELEAAQLLKPTLSCDLIATKVSGYFIESNNCPTIGTYTNTWTFTDICGRKSDEYVQVITIEDTGAPIITCPIVSTNYNVDENSCTYEGTFIATATDTCSEATIVYKVNGVPISFPYNFPAGTTIVTAIAKDDCNNVSEACTFEVVVIDDNKPEITCPTVASSYSVDLGKCDYTATFEATATDNCTTITSYTYSVDGTEISFPYDFQVGTNEVSVVATDSNGNTSDPCSFEVVVIDDNKPEITCPTVASSYNVDLGECDYTATFEATATDNCTTITTYTYSVDGTEISFPYDFPVGTTEVSVVATDSNGNTSDPCSFEVVVIDDNKPEITCPTVASSYSVDLGECDYTATFSATATDNCTTITSYTYSVDGTEISFPYDFPVGTTAVSVVATDSYNNTSEACTFEVVVIDDAPPVIDETTKGNLDIECGVGDTVLTLETWLTNNAGATATDNCGLVTWDNNYGEDTSVKCDGDYIIVTFTATDVNGLTSTTTAGYLIKDETGPIITNQPLNETVECDGAGNMDALNTWLVNNGGATAIDDCSIVTWSNDYTELIYSCSFIGEVEVIFTVTDACGNETATEARKFIIEDNEAPVFVENLPVNTTVSCEAIPEAVILTATDNCSISSDLKVNYTEKITGQDDECASEYKITRTWSVSDCAGNEVTHIQEIVIEDNEAPVFVGNLPANTTVSCDTIPAAIVLTASDNCSISSDLKVNYTEKITGQDDECASEYKITRTWSVSDCAGNNESYVQEIIVEDTTAPVFVENLPVDTTVSCDAVPEAVILTATDNCSASSDLKVDYTEEITGQDDECASEYKITRTWSVSDCAGNNESYVQEIIVEDKKAPILISELEDINIECDAIPEIPTLEFTDNCSATVTQINFEEENTFDGTDNDYQIIRVWTVSDTCGNVADFTQTINVTIKTNVTEVSDSKCIDDGEVDLNDYLTDNTEGDGVWEVTTGNVSLSTDATFDPSNIALGDYIFTYTVSSQGCLSAIKVTININDDCIVLPCGLEDVKISKAVTPNGDSWNEFFEVTGVESCGFVTNVKIFNRWGARVFKSDNYANNWNGISDGTTFGGAKRLPAGTYYYIVILENSGLKPFTGAIYLGTK